MSNSRFEKELTSEREYIALLYGRLDDERRNAAAAMSVLLRDSSSTNQEARWQRDVFVQRQAQRVHRLRAAESGLCFGRIDNRDGDSAYIGRLGLFDENNDYEPLLMDWRAPASRPFYCATTVNPEGVALRRHFRTFEREVLDFHDEALDLSVPAADQDPNAALLAALNAPREETMRDIVSTIQAEQDEIIRFDLSGVLVIEGGPGTGKTAVALHRVAYLLYTQRERMARRGVLIIGPNSGFLRYIGDVLPSLGETAVVFATPGELMPGVVAMREDPPDSKRVKGSLAMVDVLAAAVADRQAVPEEPIPIELDDVTVKLDRGIAESARERARTTKLLHNEARSTFRDAVILALTQRAVNRIGSGLLPPEEMVAITPDVRAELIASTDLHAAVDQLWPVLTPQRLVAELLSSRERIAAAASELSETDQAALFRADGDAWTVSDVPLLDEAAELLGEDRSEALRRAERERQEQLDFAEGVLQILDTDEDPDGEVLRAVDLLTSDSLSERHIERDHRDLAERAAADREWTYGHVVVDEAQEMSIMDWRMIMRRCPSRSMTIVGDLAQRQSAAGATSWSDMLGHHVSDRWHYRQLTVNYRTPSEIMTIAASVLAMVDSSLRPPDSVRDSGISPWARQVSAGDLESALANAVEENAGEGTVAVIVPEGFHPDIPGTVLTPRESKGLEFDTVIIAEPQEILANPDTGAAELYVALTRSTKRLGMVHSAPLPSLLRIETR